MKQPPLEVADIIRAQGSNFLEQSPGWFTWQHLKVFRAITCCRTAALGGHLDQCSECGYRAISFCSCRNRHCPKCQTNARNKWLAARSQELLGTGYFHLVFTLPHQLSGLALQNKTILYDLLLRASAETLLEVAADSEHLGAEIGFLSVLHTWGADLADYSRPAGRKRYRTWSKDRAWRHSPKASRSIKWRCWTATGNCCIAIKPKKWD